MHNPAPIYRLLNRFGGCIYRWGSASGEAAYFAAKVTFGQRAAGHTKDDLIHSKLILLWGFNPAENVWGTGTSYHLVRAKERGIRIIGVDPRYTDTLATFADEWIPIRVGTDTALLIAMANVIYRRNLHDPDFLAKYTFGFEAFRHYFLGHEDGIDKTPEWAQGITGVQAKTIEDLAVAYATANPAALLPSFAPGRTAFGEQFHRAGAALAAMTGNVGISGGSPGCCDIPAECISPGPNMPNAPSLIPTGWNPLEPEDAAGHPMSFATRSHRRVHNAKMWDAILEGKAGGFPGDVRCLYVVCANPLNQAPNTNKGVRALQRLECIVVQEQFMTATARFADIILSATTHWERDDYMRPWLGGDYHLFGNRAIEPVGEAKSDLDIAVALAERLGITGYSDRSSDAWLEHVIGSAPDSKRDIETTRFRETGLAKARVDRPVIAFRDQIRSPERVPFPTPSGKIEIYSNTLAEMNEPNLPPIPKFIEPWEGLGDPLRRKYPLQLITYHFRTRANSCFHNVPRLRELEEHAVWINPRDAEPRDIAPGRLVKVFNDRGTILVPAKGVVAIGQGAWFEPDEKGMDRGGCANVLTRDEASPGGGTAYNTALVEVAPGDG
jgi:anaerobic dimethyl sulfoxide reductase subunit A